MTAIVELGSPGSHILVVSSPSCVGTATKTAYFCRGFELSARISNPLAAHESKSWLPPRKGVAVARPPWPQLPPTSPSSAVLKGMS